jgi:hypothetical protein
MGKFDFDTVGKRLPYDVPEGYIHNFSVKRAESGRGVLRRASLFVAASLFLVVISGLFIVYRDKKIPSSFESYEIESMIKELSDDELVTLSMILDDNLFND